MASWNNWVVSEDKSNVLLDEFVNFTPDAIQQAGRDISDEGEPYPPTIGKIKQKALLNENKHLSVSASTAWGHVAIKIEHRDFKLTDLELRAVNCTCKIPDLRMLNVNELGYQRNFFMTHYEELRNMEIKKIVATPQVDNLLGSSDARRLEGE